jgi:NAD(P)-dependent dehydrogenase (short-subunit alcohol dehydrogenase family)
MPRPLDEAVVVITGASSGVGRAAALGFAQRGASLGLCARGAGPLEEVATDCRGAGAEVLNGSLDVGEEDAVERFAAAVVARFGRIDVWVNCAATMAYGRFSDIPSEIFRSVVETNLMGQVHGSRAALRRFRDQGSGVLVNVSSVWGRVSSPEVSPYVVSKNAVRALSECIAAELAAEKEIHVVTIVPESVDTPIFVNAANYTGRRIRPIPPVLSPEVVAQGILECAERPRREVTFGRAGRMLEVLYSIYPGLYRRFAHSAFLHGTMAPLPQKECTGNVLRPVGVHAVVGGWRRQRRPVLRRALRDAIGGGLLGLVGSRSR